MSPDRAERRRRSNKQMLIVRPDREFFTMRPATVARLAMGATLAVAIVVLSAVIKNGENKDQGEPTPTITPIEQMDPTLTITFYAEPTNL